MGFRIVRSWRTRSDGRWRRIEGTTSAGISMACSESHVENVFMFKGMHTFLPDSYLVHPRSPEKRRYICQREATDRETFLYDVTHTIPDDSTLVC